ncbi:zonadhesin, partial [Paroedura picta]|uniref:zonadhesin n=1 Tax=Paroedura picta TaxID=143630 RepID=UPI004057C29F
SPKAAASPPSRDPSRCSGLVTSELKSSDLLGTESSSQLLGGPPPAGPAPAASAAAATRQLPKPDLPQATSTHPGGRANAWESCVISGDPHYKTYDGYFFSFMGNCTYLLSEVCHPLPGLPTFRVEETNAHRAGYEQVSHVKSVTVEVNGTQIVLLKGRRVTVDGQQVHLPVAVAGGQVSVHLSGIYVLLQTRFGLRVRFDGNHYAEVSAPYFYMGHLCGLCGNYNGEMLDDNLMPNGTSAGSDANRLGESWQVPGTGDLGCTNSGKPVICSVAVEAEGLTKCGGLTDAEGLFAPCHSKVPPREAFDSCIYDYCATAGDHLSLCFALQSYAERCAQAGVHIGWRGTFSCFLHCPPNSSYRSCGPVCPTTCLDPDGADRCPDLPCVEGCVCKKGSLLSGDQCVPPGACGCTDPSGRYHPAAESWTEGPDCTRRCTCEGFHNITCQEWHCSPTQECRTVDGLWGCQDTGVASCQVSGDPHYFTFDGAMLSFMGSCTYTLVTTACGSSHPVGLPPFTLTGRNEERGQPQASFLRQVTLELPGANLTLQKGPRVLLNGRRVRVPVVGQVPGLTVTSSGLYILLQTSFGLGVKFDGEHLLEVQLPGDYFGQVCGLCGNFNNQSQDDLLMPDGQLAANASQFGNSWRVPGEGGPSCQPDERQEEGPGCSPQELGRMQVQCREILAPKFQPCHAVLDPLPFLQNCLYDMCHFQGMASMLCHSLQAYVEACQTRGVRGLSWRNSTFCAPSCPPQSRYVECAPLCPATCLDPFAPLSCQSPAACAEGCVCDWRYVWSDNQCVLRQECGCEGEMSVYYQHQESYLRQHCQELCTCRQELISCNAFQCPPGSRCGLSPAGLDVCQPLEFHRCVIFGDPHYRTFDHFVHHFQGRATYTLTRTRGQLPGALESLWVTGRNWARLPTHRVSFLHEVSLSVYGYRIALLQGRQLVVNGVEVAPPFYPEEGLQITQSGRSLLVQTGFGFSVSFDGRNYAEIVLPSTYKGHVGGLCGNYDGQPSNEYMKPDGTWTQSLTVFGNSWQVPAMEAALGKEVGAGGRLHDRQEEQLAGEADLGFQVACRPEWLALVNGTEACGALSDLQGPFVACHSILPPSTFQESCVYDLCALGNDTEVLCQDYAAYARLCQEEGVELGPWRQKTGCEMSCPPHTTYSPCMTACPATCANMAAPSDCDASCVEGCASDPGQVLSGLESVPFGQCGCSLHGQYHQINETFLTEDCSQRCSCLLPGRLVCEASGCPGSLLCTTANYTRGCFPASACLSSPCVNGATCEEDLLHGYRCRCAEGYMGLRCQSVVPEATPPPPPTSASSPASPAGQRDHLPAILSGVLVPVGVLLVAGAAFAIYRRRKQLES